MSSFCKFSGLATSILFVDIQSVNAVGMEVPGNAVGMEPVLGHEVDVSEITENDWQEYIGKEIYGAEPSPAQSEEKIALIKQKINENIQEFEFDDDKQVVFYRIKGVKDMIFETRKEATDAFEFEFALLQEESSTKIEYSKSFNIVCRHLFQNLIINMISNQFAF